MLVLVAAILLSAAADAPALQGFSAVSAARQRGWEAKLR